jgi:hypothetical protein
MVLCVKFSRLGSVMYHGISTEKNEIGACGGGIGNGQ